MIKGDSAIGEFLKEFNEPDPTKAEVNYDDVGRNQYGKDNGK
jgi:hypothetical protein